MSAPRPWLCPDERRYLTRRRLRFWIVAAALFAWAHALDPWVHAHVPGKSVEIHPWYQFFRTFGSLYPWLFIGAAFVLHDLHAARRRRRAASRPRGIGLVLSSVVGGLLAEALKLLLRRERPGAEETLWTWRLDGWLDGSGLGLPSSHAAVAFAGACYLARLLPWSWPLLVLLAVGCAATRVLADAHWLSDVVLGAVVGLAAAGVVHRRLHPPSPIGWLP